MQDGPLAYSVEFEDRSTYAFARISAPKIDREMAFSYLSEIVMKCADIRRKKLLLERDIPGLMNDSDMSLAMAKLLSMGSGMKIAILNRNPGLGEALEKAMNSACTSDSNCGYFNDFEEAERWLMASA